MSAKKAGGGDAEVTREDANAIAWAIEHAIDEKLHLAHDQEIGRLVQPKALAQWWQKILSECRARGEHSISKEIALDLGGGRALLGEAGALEDFLKDGPRADRLARVREAAGKREAAAIAKRVGGLVDELKRADPKDHAKALLAFQQGAMRLSGSRDSGGPRSLGDALSEALKRAKATDKKDFLRWPQEWDKDALKTISEKLGGSRGLGRGLHVIIGGTGSGKSALALQLALSHAKQGGAVLYVSTELDEDHLAVRLAALGSEGAVSWSRALEGDQEAINALSSAEDFKDAKRLIKLWNPPQERATVDAVRAEVMALLRPNAKDPAPLVIIDYLQQIQVESDASDLRQRVSGVATALRNKLAKPSSDGWPGAIVLALSSAPRGGYDKLSGGGDGRTPEGATMAKAQEILAAGKESGEIEYCSDSVWGLVIGDALLGTADERRWLIAAKRRTGGAGLCIALRFNGAAGRFLASGAEMLTAGNGGGDSSRTDWGAKRVPAAGKRVSNLAHIRPEED